MCNVWCILNNTLHSTIFMYFNPHRSQKSEIYTSTVESHGWDERQNKINFRMLLIVYIYKCIDGGMNLYCSRPKSNYL
jgi:hypothetical protein